MSEERTSGYGLWELREGDEFRLKEDGPLRTCVRISPGAAYYEIVTENTYEAWDKKANKTQTLTRKSRKTTYIAARSGVWMVKRGPLVTRDVMP